jgi:protein-tyrosine phosphatase
LPPEVMQAMCTPMHQILSPSSISGASTGSLYIGSLSAVHDKDLLRDHRISHLVQVLDAPWLPISEKDGFDCHRISILDHNTVDLKPYLEGACNYIDRALRSGRNVLVHCQQVRIDFLCPCCLFSSFHAQYLRGFHEAQL